jgi:carboxylesterase type B
MVWIHGGGFYIGSGNSNFHGPDHLISEDVVLVTINYRLGALGQFKTIILDPADWLGYIRRFGSKA